MKSDIIKKWTNIKKQLEPIKRIEDQNAEYLPEAISPMLDCHQGLEKLDEYVFYLKKIVSNLKEIVSNYGWITPPTIFNSAN